MVIQIQISDEQWNKLNAMKNRGESFEEVLDRLFEQVKVTKQPNSKLIKGGLKKCQL